MAGACPLCKTGQTRRPAAGQDDENSMSGLITLLVVLAAAVMLFWLRRPGKKRADSLGWMSDQWLAQHRASRPT